MTNSKNNKEIIPERRRKYLAGASDDQQMNPSVGQKMMGVDNLELMDDS